MVGSIFYDGTKKFEDGSVAYNLFGYYDGFMGVIQTSYKAMI